MTDQHLVKYVEGKVSQINRFWQVEFAYQLLKRGWHGEPRVLPNENECEECARQRVMRVMADAVLAGQEEWDKAFIQCPPEYASLVEEAYNAARKMDQDAKSTGRHEGLACGL